MIPVDRTGVQIVELAAYCVNWETASSKMPRTYWAFSSASFIKHCTTVRSNKSLHYGSSCRTLPCALCCAVPDHGVRSIGLPREPARHRSLCCCASRQVSAVARNRKPIDFARISSYTDLASAGLLLMERSCRPAGRGGGAGYSKPGTFSRCSISRMYLPGIA